MKNVLYAVAVICASVMVHPLSAQGRTPTSITCAAAKNLSLLRAWSTDSINVAENIPLQECRFTVNNAPASGNNAGQGSRTPTLTSCVAAKNLSVVRALSTDTVSVAENIPQRECRFAINGSPGSGDGTAHTRALKSVLDWSSEGALPLTGLALLLATGDDHSASLVRVLEENAKPLRACFTARAQAEAFQFSSRDITCASVVSDSRESSAWKSSLGVQFITAMPHLRLAVSSAGTTQYLFLPPKAR